MIFKLFFADYSQEINGIEIKEGVENYTFLNY